MKTLRFIALALMFVTSASFADVDDENYTKPDKFVTKPYNPPYERPIGFTLNLGAISSMTAEGRFLLGLVPHLSLVISPMFQQTIDFPYYLPDASSDDFIGLFSIRRANLGIGLRGNFYAYDSRSHWYLEGLGRGGFTWVGKENYVWSVIPSLMVGHMTVYDSGYAVSFGMGLEWEFLLGKEENMGPKTKKLKSTFIGMTKIPLTAELSIGWMW